MERQWPGYLLATIVIAGTAWLLWPQKEPMPEVRFTLTDGRVIESSDLRGKPVLINFWSVSCEICLRDMPALSRLHDTLQDRDFTVIGVAMPYDPPPAIQAVVEKLAPSYPIALDPRGELSAAFGKVEVTPTTFLIDREGNIRFTARGALDETRMRATVLTF